MYKHTFNGRVTASCLLFSPSSCLAFICAVFSNTFREKTDDEFDVERDDNCLDLLRSLPMSSQRENDRGWGLG